MSKFTGYTAPILTNDNITLKDYIMGCSKAFTGDYDFIKCMDEDVTYYEEGLAEASLKYNNCVISSDEVAIADFVDSLKSELKSREDALKETHISNEKYQSMRDKVVAWQETDALKNIKKFAIEQIDSCLDYDYENSIKEDIERIKEKLQNPEKYYDKSKELKRLMWYVDYNAKQLDEAKERREKNLEWYNTLKHELDLL